MKKLFLSFLAVCFLPLAAEQADTPSPKVTQSALQSTLRKEEAELEKMSDDDFAGQNGAALKTRIVEEVRRSERFRVSIEQSVRALNILAKTVARIALLYATEENKDRIQKINALLVTLNQQTNNLQNKIGGAIDCRERLESGSTADRTTVLKELRKFNVLIEESASLSGAAAETSQELSKTYRPLLGLPAEREEKSPGGHQTEDQRKE